MGAMRCQTLHSEGHKTPYSTSNPEKDGVGNSSIGKKEEEIMKYFCS